MYLIRSFVLRVEAHEYSIHFRVAFGQAAMHGHLTNAAEAYTGRYMAYAGNRRESL